MSYIMSASFLALMLFAGSTFLTMVYCDEIYGMDGPYEDSESSADIEVR